jgi:hypothetical protein
VNADETLSIDVNGLLAAYCATAERWNALQSNAKAANKVFDANHGLYKRLRVTAEGRAGITRLMAHPTVGVRLLAAAHSLGWAPEEAVATLEAIEETREGLHSVTAKYTLRSFRSGSLDLDW